MIEMKYSDNNNQLKFSTEDRFVQGIFIPYGITTDDKAIGQRDGGFGSTGT